VACIGLQNAGKSSLVTVLTDNHFTEEMIPTVSVMRCRRAGPHAREESRTTFPFCIFRRLKPLSAQPTPSTPPRCEGRTKGRPACYPDLAGQPRFRSIWERYCSYPKLLSSADVCALCDQHAMQTSWSAR
jgi:GTPase SAR1 family protein